MAAAKAKSIEITKSTRTKSRIVIDYTQGEGAFELDERDNPLPAFNKAFEALPALVMEICHLPETWLPNLRVIGFEMGSQGGGATVSLICRKSFDDAAKELQFKTPPRFLEHPTEPGSYTPALPEKLANLVWEAVEQSKEYVKGNRAQGQLPLGSDDDEDGDEDPHSNVTPLPGMEESPGAVAPAQTDSPEPQPRKRRRAPKKARAK